MGRRNGIRWGLVGLALLCAGCGEGDNGTRDTARFQEDLFPGPGSTGPFDVRFSPILADGVTVTIGGTRQVVPTALTVLVDGQPQREGVDYDAILPIGRIIFRRIVPSAAVVTVRYYYAVRPATLTPPPTPPSGTWTSDAE